MCRVPRIVVVCLVLLGVGCLWSTSHAEPCSADEENCVCIRTDCFSSAVTTTRDSHQYYYNEEKLTWEAARQKCFECGASLAKIETREEMDFINNWVTTSGIAEQVLGPLRSRNIWVDGTDQGEEGCFLWTYPEVTKITESPFFGSKQPDDDRKPIDEDCIGIWKNDWLTHDLSCAWVAPYICETHDGPIVPLPPKDEYMSGAHC